MAKPEMGIKRQCQACGAKFFDMNREKIVCPKCGTPFTVTVAARAPSRAPAAAVDDEEKDTDAAPDIVSLEDADAADDALPADDDAEAADDDTAGAAFLEEEEEDGHDVTGLIDGDIETDEEP